MNAEAAARLFLKRGFRAGRMDELDEAASFGRRTLYIQFESQEEIFREMLLKAASVFEIAFPPSNEPQRNVEPELRSLEAQPESSGDGRFARCSSSRARPESVSSNTAQPFSCISTKRIHPLFEHRPTGPEPSGRRPRESRLRSSISFWRGCRNRR